MTRRLLLFSVSTALAARLPAQQPDATASCGSGLVAVPTATRAAPSPASPAPTVGGALAGAALKRITGKKADTLPAGSVADSKPSFTCMTQEQAAAMQGATAPTPTTNAAAEGGTSAGGASAGSVTSGLGSVVGGKTGAVTAGAIAAAPIAGKGLKALGGMFGRGGPSRENVIRDLGRGRLQLRTIRFIERSDALKEGFENELAFVGEALQSVAGEFMLTIQPESSGNPAMDSAMVDRRLVKLSTYLQIAGIAESRVSATAGVAASLSAKAAKPGDSRVEIVRVEGPRQ